jgi:hydroxypyruvate reductase 1
MGSKDWRIHNAAGSRRVIVTKELPGERWLDMLVRADCKVEICTSPDILSTEEIKAAFGGNCS